MIAIRRADLRRADTVAGPLLGDRRRQMSLAPREMMPCAGCDEHRSHRVGHGPGDREAKPAPSRRVGRLLDHVQAERIHERKAGEVKQHIATLEHNLGVRLLNRSTRSLCVTDEGRRFSGACQQMLETALHAVSEIAATRDEAVGLMRLTASVHLGATFLPFQYTEILWHFVDLSMALRAVAMDLPPSTAARA